MPTFACTHLPPTPSLYPPSEQPTIPASPPTFLAALTIRHAVFVQEQGVPPEFEFDSDDPRSHHWVAHLDDKPVGTIRLVPFPHASHPVPGGVYVNGKLTSLPPRSPSEPPASHDRNEPYVKLGRLAVLKAARGQGVGLFLVKTALDWMVAHASSLDNGEKQWQGLVCVHAQKSVVGMWERAGFVVDEKMGDWIEEGIWHVGMLRRMGMR